MQSFIYTSTATFNIKKHFASVAEAIAWGNEYFAFFKVPYRLFTQPTEQWLEVTSR